MTIINNDQRASVHTIKITVDRKMRKKNILCKTYFDTVTSRVANIYTNLMSNSHRPTRRDKTIEFCRICYSELSRRQSAGICNNLNNLSSTEFYLISVADPSGLAYINSNILIMFS